MLPLCVFLPPPHQDHGDLSAVLERPPDPKRSHPPVGGKALGNSAPGNPDKLALLAIQTRPCTHLV